MIKKNNYNTWIVLSLLIFISCGKNKKQNTVTSNESQLINSEKPESIIKDSVTYYNGNQKVIEITEGEYFGFMFETNGQQFNWRMENAIDDSYHYVSESYEPQPDHVEEVSNGIQLFTFKSLKKGKTKIVFQSKDSKEKKIIQIHIK
ncbi:MAG TPA: hypothetical protein VIG94_10355 [Faecalibacter sp.]